MLLEIAHKGRPAGADIRVIGMARASASAGLCRGQEMDRGGLIQGDRAVLDRTRLGGAVTVFVTSTPLRKDAAAFEVAKSAAPEVRACHNISGGVEYLLRSEDDDLAAYKQFHADTPGRVSQVASITSSISLASPKDLRA